MSNKSELSKFISLLNKSHLEEFKNLIDDVKNEKPDSIIDKISSDIDKELNKRTKTAAVNLAISKKGTTIPKEQWGVHENHCCLKHGCKYGDKDCPVEMELTKQIYPCEDCHWETSRRQIFYKA